MAQTPPDPQVIARWLLAYEAGEDAGAQPLRASAERVYGQLRESLVVFLGQRGFDSLWSRAMSLAQRHFPSGHWAVGEEGLALLPGVRIPAHEDTPDAVDDVLHAAFASFIGLLFTFVGSDLGVRLISQIWTTFPSAVSADELGEVPHE